MNKINTVIMAGGKGTRLMPLTADTPKPLLPIGQKPMLSHIFERLLEANIGRCALTLGYLGDEIERYYQKGYKSLELFYSREQSPLGSAGGVKRAYEGIFGGKGDLLVLSGDCIFEFSVESFVNAAQKSGAYAALICKWEEDCRRFGRVECKEHSFVSGFYEKDERFSGGGLINCGVYFISERAMKDIPSKEFYDFGRDFFPASLEKSERVYAHRVDGFFCDVGTKESYLRCNLRENGGKSVVSDKAYASASAFIASSVILPGASIGAHSLIENSVVGKNCVVGAGSIVRAGSFLSTGTNLPDGSIVSSDMRII